MTATLTPPPPDVTSRLTGSRVANRAVARWARRLLRREWRQQLLVICLLTVAVAATTVGLGLVVNVQGSNEANAGTASLRLDIQSPGNLAAIATAAQHTLGTVELFADSPIPIPGSTATVDLRAQQPHGHFSSPMLGLVSGRYPVGAGEVAVTRAVLSTLQLRVGQTWSVLGQNRRIVGIVENPQDLSQTFALVAPGQIANPNSVSILADSSDSAAQRFHTPSGQLVGIMSTGASASQRKAQQALAVLLLATIGLTFIGLLSVAGFTVMAQRRLRSLGMIGAIGATDRQVRKMMLANGTAVGFVGAVTGTVLGLAAWFAFKPAFEHLVGHRIDPLSIPWWAVLLAAALAVLASLAASWWPARTVSRMPVVAALAGRPPVPQPAHRFALLGTVLAVAGFVLLAHNSRLPLIVFGILATTAGMLLLAPLGIQALALLAGRSPVAVRLALRDLARYQARSGAALAAVSLAVGIAATIAISAAAQQAHDRSATVGNLPSDQLIVWVNGSPNSPGGGAVAAAPGPNRSAGPSQQQIDSARSAAASIAQSLSAGSPLELDALTNPAAGSSRLGSDGGYAQIVNPVTENGRKGFTFVDQPYLATDALLNHYGITASDIHTGTQVLTSRTDLTAGKLFDGAKDALDDVQIQVIGKLPQYTAAPDTLLTQQEATKLGLMPQSTGFLVQSHSALTASQIRAARAAAVAAGVTVETRTAPDSSMQRLRDYATLVGILLALGVLAMTVGLIRSETSGDLRTLTAAGAGGITRRMLTATTAAALGLLGGIIGVAGAYLALIAWHWHHINYLDQPPYLELAAMVIGLPIAALVGGWLVGRTPSHLSRTRSE
jgi:putative ABC transport system permease protein